MKKKLLLWLLTILGLLHGKEGRAVLNENPSSSLFVNFASNDPQHIIEQLINILLALAGTVSILFMMIGGAYYIMSGANEDLAKKGKAYFKNSVIGLIIIVLSYTIISVIYRQLA